MVLSLMNVQADNEEPHWQASATRTPKFNFAGALVSRQAFILGLGASGSLFLSVAKALAAILLIAGAQVPVAAQELTDSRYDQARFDTELHRLTAICDKLQLAKEAEICKAWTLPQRGDQLNLYLPVDLHEEQQASREQSSWAAHFNKARQLHADFLYGEALRVCSSDEALAYSLLWQTLRANPDHELTKNVIGILAKGSSVRPRLVRARIPHPEFHWPAGSYSRVETPHFELTTRADAKQSMALAARLEDFYVLWTQVFYPLWSPPGLLDAKLKGKATPWPRRRGIEVFLLKDRADYLQALSVAEDNIAVSVGYYNAEAQKSFFYPVQGSDETLYHELTHQLLMEATSIDAQPSSGDRQGIWLLEGIALYMESLTPYANHWTVGGCESPRLQTSRYRGVRDGFWPDWLGFCSGNIQTWKSDPAISNLYTHAAGLTHIMLDALGPTGREAYFRALIATYQGQTESDSLLKLLGEDEKAAKRKYQDLLVLTDAQVASIVASRRQPTELVLCASELSPDTWQLLSHFQQLSWLDLSFSNVQLSDLQWLANASSLTRLSLEGTAVDGQVLQLIATLPKLEELDLTGCAISDGDLNVLRGQPSIQTLWLGQTAITQESLAVLASLPKLRQCDVLDSKISPEAWTDFLRQHSMLK